MSLRLRLVILTSTAVTCAIVIAAFICYGVVHDQLYKEIDDSLRSRAAQLADVPFLNASGAKIQFVTSGQVPGQTQSGAITCSASTNSPPPTPPINPSQLPAGCAAGVLSGNFSTSGGQVAIGVPGTTLGAAGDYTQFIGVNGSKVLSAGETQELPVTKTDLAIAAGQQSQTLRTDTVNGISVRIDTAPQANGYAVMVSRPLDETDTVLTNLRETLIIIALAGVAIAGALGVLAARTTLRPVRRLLAATDHVAGTTDLSRRIDISGSGELVHLARSFNQMMDALERSHDSQKHLIADASHELRTPLTSLRTNIEVMMRDTRMRTPERNQLLGSVKSQLERLSDLVNGLLDLARGSETISGSAEVSLSEVTYSAVELTKLHWPKVSFNVAVEDEVSIQVNANRIERFLTNLLDNAGKWSPEGSSVEVILDTQRIRVMDHGSGITPEDRERVFDRFWRAPSARNQPGSGLGLAIVRQVAQENGWTVGVEETPGGGATFVVSFS